MTEPLTTATRVVEAAAFYRTFAEDLTSLSRRSADIDWTSDLGPRSRRGHQQSKPLASTGRLARAATTPAKQQAGTRTGVSTTPSRLDAPVFQRTSTRVSAPRPPSSAPKSGGVAVVEVSTKKPSYLADMRTRPQVLSRRGAQPRYQPQGQSGIIASDRQPRARNLRVATPSRGAVGGRGGRNAGDRSHGGPQRIDAPWLDVAYVGGAGPFVPGSAASESLVPSPSYRGSPLPSPRSGTVPAASPHSAAARQERSGDARSSSASSGGALDAPVPVAQEEEEALSSSSRLAAISPLVAAEIAEPGFPQQLPSGGARLAGVVDLQLLLPEGFMQLASGTDHCNQQTSSIPIGPDRQGHTAISSLVDDRSVLVPDSLPTPATSSRGPSPVVRPVLRGLIADVINDEMRVPIHESAEVSGGMQLTSLFGLPRRREQSHGINAAGPLPPSEGASARATPEPEPTLAASAGAQTSPRHVKAQAEFEVQAQLLLQAQARAHADRDEALQLARNVQQHADDAQQRLVAAIEQQSASLQRGAAELQQQLVDAAMRELREMRRETEVAAAERVAASSAVPIAIPRSPRAPLSPGLSRPVITELESDTPSNDAALAVVAEGFQRLESQLERQSSDLLRLQSSQIEERAAHLAALASLPHMAPPRVQVLPVTMRQREPPAPPPPPPPPPCVQTAVQTAEVPVVEAAAQTTRDREEQDAKTARFTEYLLHGPPGARVLRNGLVQPRFPWPLPADTSSVVQRALRPQRETPAPPSASSSVEDSTFSSSGVDRLVARSPGEIASSLTGDAATRRGAAAASRLSPGQTSPVPFSPGETASEAASVVAWGEASSLGEVPSPGAVASQARRSVAQAVPIEPGEAPSTGEAPSSGEVSQLSAAVPMSAQLEESVGEVVGVLESGSEGEAASDGEASANPPRLQAETHLEEGELPREVDAEEAHAESSGEVASAADPPESPPSSGAYVSLPHSSASSPTSMPSEPPVQP